MEGSDSINLDSLHKPLGGLDHVPVFHEIILGEAGLLPGPLVGLSSLDKCPLKCNLNLFPNHS